MTLQRKIGFWLSAFLILAVLLYVLRDVLMPFVAAFILAYLLDPLARRLQNLGLGRLGATLIILIVFLVAFLLLLITVVPFFASQLFSLVERLPGYVARLQQVIAEQGGPLLDRIGGGQKVLADIQSSLKDVLGQGAGFVGRFLASVWSGGQAVAGLLSLLVITPVVAFYLLLDWDRMLGSVDSWIPVDQRQTVRDLAGEMDRAISGFIRGQSLLCLILGGFYAAGLALIGLNFGVLIGMIAGLISFIPYVGTLVGLLLAVGVAVAQFWPDWTMVAATVALFAVGNFIEGNILAPKLVGDSVGLHPVWLMFALLAFGSLLGFIGLLLAVPLAASAAVLIRFGLRQYLASPWHGGLSKQVKPGVDA
jgi:predicted PurR-regulated permease PerM